MAGPIRNGQLENGALIPSSSEKDALAGSVGTPSSSNTYLTEATIDDASTAVDRIYSANKIDALFTAVSSGYNRREKVIDLVNPTLAPPTEVSGDRYALDFDAGTVDAGWDGAAKGDIVEFNGTLWVATTTAEGWVTYNDTDNVDILRVDDGTPAWEIRDFTDKNTLDEAYDEGGAGLGRTITVDAGAVALTQPVLTSGSPSILDITGGANTTLAADTESTDVNFNLGRTVEFTAGGGGFTDQRAIRVQAPTYSATAAETITTASTLSIDNAPSAGTNMTLTNAFAVDIQAGLSNLADGVEFVERADHVRTPPAGKGSLWVRNDTPNSLIFTDDAGTDYDLTATVVDTQNTLDEAYDEGGAGAGRTITVDSGAVALTQPVIAGGTPSILAITGGANTGLTADTESVDVDMNLARTVEFTAGAGGFTNQRAVHVQAPTYAATASETITTAATLALSGAPAAGTNMTLTNTFALDVESDLTNLSDGLEMTERADHVRTPPAGKGALWVRNDTPSALIYTDDAGTDFNLTLAGTDTQNTLDQAYDEGGAGAGRTITVDSGAVALTQPVLTSGSPTILEITGGANTTLAADTEAVDVQFNLARTVQFTQGAGAFNNQRAIQIQSPTYAATTAETITTAATVAIDGAPSAGTNMTLTNSFALHVETDLTALDDGVEMVERAAVFRTPPAGSGGLWVRNDSPNALMYTDDAGTDYALTGVTAVLDNIYDDEFTAAGGSETFNLTATTRANANMTSARHIIGVYRNGQRLRYNASPSTVFQYGVPANNQINVVGATAGDVYQVVYGV